MEGGIDGNPADGRHDLNDLRPQLFELPPQSPQTHVAKSLLVPENVEAESVNCFDRARGNWVLKIAVGFLARVLAVVGRERRGEDIDLGAQARQIPWQNVFQIAHVAGKDFGDENDAHGVLGFRRKQPVQRRRD